MTLEQDAGGRTLMFLTLYGSLRQGGQIGHYLNSLRRLGISKTGRLPGLRIYVAGAVPGAVFTGDENDYTIVEYLSVHLTYFNYKKTFKFLDRVEGVEAGLYRRDQYKTPEGTSWIYTICNPEKYENMPVVHDWLEWTAKDEEEKRRIIESCNPDPEVLIGFF